MSSLNQITLIGNLGDHAEVRTTQSGMVVMTLSVATSEKFKSKNGEAQEKTEWHRVVVFNEKLTNAIEDYLRKGTKVMIQGKMTYRKYTDKAGIEKYTAEVVLNTFEGKIILLGGTDRRTKDSDSDERPARASAKRETKAAAKPTQEEQELLDDEVPF